MHFAGLSYDLSQPLYSNYTVNTVQQYFKRLLAQLSTNPTCRVAHSMANQILTRMSMAFRTARISSINEYFRYARHGNAVLSLAVLQTIRQMAELPQVRAASRESKEIDFGDLIDIQIQLSTAAWVITVNHTNVGGLRV
jgi:hypothetical protein